MNGFLLYFLILIVLGIGNVIYNTYKSEEVPELEEVWWGQGSRNQNEDRSIHPFKINVPEKEIEDLRYRLKNHRPFTPPLEGVQHEYGINTNLLDTIVKFWNSPKYNWREREQYLNRYPQFTTTVQGLKLHYIHVKPSSNTNLKVVPILLLHGWPGSVREFYEVIPILTQPQKGRDFVFEVVVPSLPGYGFSDAATKRGMNIPQVAVLFKNLMRRLGHEKFYVQGGDWGSAIASSLAVHFPDHVEGIHLNMCISSRHLTTAKLLVGSLWPGLVVKEKKWADKMYPLSRFFSFILNEFGYMHLQATKPDTLGVGLHDSPVGLAAYLLEKFSIWTDPKLVKRADGGLEDKFTLTRLLDNVMIYWVSGSITTSMRFYAENLGKESNAFTATYPVNVPTACPSFEHELIHQPEFLYKDLYRNVVHQKDYNAGHFAALEVPEVLANDVWIAVDKFLALKNKKNEKGEL